MNAYGQIGKLFAWIFAIMGPLFVGGGIAAVLLRGSESWPVILVGALTTYLGVSTILQARRYRE